MFFQSNKKNMKLLVVLFATVLVAQLGNAGVVGSSPNDGVEEYQDFQYMGM